MKPRSDATTTPRAESREGSSKPNGEARRGALTDGEERARAVVVLVDDGGAAAEEVDGPRLVHHLGVLGIRRAGRRCRRRERRLVGGHGSLPRSPP